VSSKVLVFENRPRLAPELMRQFTGQPVQVMACRSINDFRNRLNGLTLPVGVLDVDAAPAACLQLLSELAGRWPSIPVIAIGSAWSAGLEWALRELGAVAFLPDFNSGIGLARLCQRQWLVGR